MNVLEKLLRKVSYAVQNHGDSIDEESKLAAQEAIDIANKLDVGKMYGIIVLAVESCEPNAEGDPGISFSCSMAGAPAVLNALSETGRDLLLAAALKEQSDALKAVVDEVMAVGSMVSKTTH